MFDSFKLLKGKKYVKHCVVVSVTCNSGLGPLALKYIMGSEY